MNLNADSKTSIEIYSKFLDTIEKVTATQTGAGTASLGEKANSTISLSESGTKAVSSTSSESSDESDASTGDE